MRSRASGSVLMRCLRCLDILKCEQSYVQVFAARLDSVPSRRTTQKGDSPQLQPSSKFEWDTQTREATARRNCPLPAVPHGCRIPTTSEGNHWKLE